MKRLFLILMMVCLINPVFAEDSGTRFSSLNGEIQTFPDGNENAKKFAKLQTTIMVNDHVVTGEESSAILSFTDMSTFLLKAESEIVISSPPSKDSKIDLVKGKIWVNVKKMAAGGTMEVKMSQAVAGIKGTNITCETNAAKTEDRITVLRGIAQLMINETKETMQVAEGESVVVKTGGKTEKQEINVQQESDKWKDELSKMGDSIELNEVPDTIRQIQQNESEKFKVINDQFNSLSAAATVSDDDSQSFKKDAERFSGVIMEDSLILNSLQTKVDKALATAGLSAASKSQIMTYQKMISDGKKGLQGFQSEIGKMLKFNFRKAAVTTDQTTQTGTSVTTQTSTGATTEQEEALDLDGLTDFVGQAQSKEGDAFRAIQDQFKSLSSADRVNTEDASAFKKECERFLSALGDDSKALLTWQNKIDAARGKTNLTASQRSQIAGLSKLVSDAGKNLQSYQSDASKYFRASFQKGTSEEVLNVQSRVSASWNDVEGILKDLQGSSGGLSQTWFNDANDRGNRALRELSEEATSLQSYMDNNSGDKDAQNLAKQISSYQNQLSKILRDLVVVPIDAAVLIEIQQTDDVLSKSITDLRSSIDVYNKSLTNAQPEVRLRQSLSILNDFSKARRLYVNAQRLYDSIMRKAASQKYQTSEQEELKNTYTRITDTYQQLGIAAEELQTQLQDLQSQLSKFLK
ncbi:MAG: FecR domain-containing protein [Candidatus Riflebacteria bacterium]|nr:FecR domain-containing protein [Candidatus Riflebacteria bacterium]